jgi:CBS domain containing-hemolysin-like protein
MNPEVVLLLFRLAAVLILLILNGFFVSVEFAYVTVPRPRIDQLAAHGNKNASIVKRLLADTDRVLAASQVGVTMASLGIGWVGQNAAEDIIRVLFGFIPPPWNTALAQGIGLVLAFALITMTHVVFGEQAPKIMAIRSADRFALMSAQLVSGISLLLHPLISLLDAATSATVRLLGVAPLGAHNTIYTVDELKQLVSETQQHGELEPREKEMLHNVFEFEDKLVRDVMIPRPEMLSLEENTTIEEFLQTFSTTSHSRFPLYGEHIDNITGFIAIKDVLRAISSEGTDALKQTVRTLARPAMFVPESKHIGALFPEMQLQKAQIAIVIDEFGGTAGMITLEELIEEIVGSLQDELAHEPPEFQAIDDHTVRIDAQLHVAEANERLNVQMPESDEYTTVAGLILHNLHHIPKEGEKLLVGNLRLTITSMSGPKIEQVLITRL